MNSQGLRYQCRSFGMCGLSLVELLISLLLGSVLSLAISSVFLESLRNFMAEDEMARLTDNGRYSLGLLRRELMLAGFLAGVVSAEKIPSVGVSSDCVQGGNWALDTVSPLDFSGNFTPSLTGLVTTVSGKYLNCLQVQDIVSGTDLVSVKRTAGNYTVKNGAYIKGSRAKNGQWYLRSENNGSTRKWIYNRSGGLPSQDTDSSAQVNYWEYYANIFYIRKFSESPGDGIPTLCVESLSGGLSLGKMTSNCLVEGVEDLQLEFGVDENSDEIPEFFKSSPTGHELKSSVVVTIFLLMRSVAEIPGSARDTHYSLGGKRVNRKDGYVRRVVSTTVKLPNLRLGVN